MQVRIKLGSFSQKLHNFFEQEQENDLVKVFNIQTNKNNIIIRRKQLNPIF